MNDLNDAAWAQAELDEWQQILEGEAMKIPTKGGVDFEPAPEGNHIGICIALADLGLQPGSSLYPNPKREVWLRFELPTERIQWTTKDGEDKEGPLTLSRRFTASMHETANLRKFIESWFGRKFPNDAAAGDFDLEKLLGRKCLLNVTHSEKMGRKFADIANATPIPKGMNADYPQYNPSVYYSIDKPNPAAFELLPGWVQEKINGRLVVDKPASNRTSGAPAAVEDFDDSIPF
jgi:hypothetical protein